MKETAPEKKTARRGDRITFGRYPQSADRADETPIEWLVLHKSGDELLVVSRYILDCKRYHEEDTDIIWRDCSLRHWLNHDFYDAAFSEEEKRVIATARCTGNGFDSPDTKDRVFLLSVAEVKALTDPGDGTEVAAMRRTRGTDFAKADKFDGCSLYVYDKGVEKDYVGEGGERKGCSWWWTRTRLQANNPARVTFIGARSNIKTYGSVVLDRVGVRPALTLKIQAKEKATSLL